MCHLLKKIVVKINAYVFSSAFIFHSCFLFHVGFCTVKNRNENVADEKHKYLLKFNMRQKKALNGSHLEVFLALQHSTKHDFDLSISNLFLTFV